KAAFCAGRALQTKALTSPARSRPEELLQSASVAFQAWHRFPARAFRALSRPREMLVSPVLTRALARTLVPASYCQAPVVARSGRSRPTACSVLSECRSPMAEAAPSSRAMAGLVEAVVASPLSQARSAARPLPAVTACGAWRPSARPTVATPARARSRQPAPLAAM